MKGHFIYDYTIITGKWGIGVRDLLVHTRPIIGPICLVAWGYP